MAEKNQPTTHSEEEWREHLDLIARLYVVEQWNFQQIADHLATLNFPTSASTVKRWLSKWRIARFKQQDELKLMASYSLHCQEIGQTVTFQRFGEDVPPDKVAEYLQRNPQTQPSAVPLPEYLQPLIRKVNTTDELTHELSHDDDHTTLGTTSLLAQNRTLGGSCADERPRKKKRYCASSSRTRSNRGSKPQQDKNKTQRPAIDVHDDESSEYDSTNDDHDTNDSLEADSSRASSSKIREVEAMIATTRKMFHAPGIQLCTVSRIMSELKALLQQAITHRNNVKAKEQQTDLGPLHLAALNNDIETMEIIVQLGADINARGGSCSTALLIAAAEDRFEALTFLVLQDGVDLDAVDFKGRTALIHAIIAKSLRSALLLVRSGANVDISPRDGMTALHWACGYSNMQSLVTQLLAATTKLNSKDEDDLTPLHIAIAGENWDYVLPIIEAGADLNVQDEDGRTAMHCACFKAPVELLMAMIEKDVDFSIKGNSDETVLHLLCQRDVSEVTEVTEAILRKANVDINAKGAEGHTPLIVATKSNSIQTVKLLVRQGADQAARDIHLNTALTVAIHKGYHEISRFLLENGSPIDPLDQSSVRFRAELEHNRKTREAESVLVARSIQPGGTRTHQTSQGPVTANNFFLGPFDSSHSGHSNIPFNPDAFGGEDNSFTDNQWGMEF